MLKEKVNKSGESNYKKRLNVNVRGYDKIDDFSLTSCLFNRS